MNRRGFFRFLATAVVAAPAIPALLEQAHVQFVAAEHFARMREARACLKAWLAESIDRDLFAAFSGEGQGDVIQITRRRHLAGREFAA